MAAPTGVILPGVQLLCKALDVYAGCENLAGYRQSNPIISADNPFSKYFDLSSVCGPTRRRKLYFGIRFRLK